ncbi:DinB family protein [Nocardia alni]|uniref:DinB family protein n=1 Tax=Nocardia alni TaxID=2815723 RepID=UPI001C2335B9|nr:DinB family protein [Nocardia alni]
MTWISPEVRRGPELLVGSEREVVRSQLDKERMTLLWKCQGLTAEQMKRRSVEPSSMSLVGLVRHLTEVERAWFRLRSAGQRVSSLYCGADNAEGDFADADRADVERDLEMYRTEIALCDAAVARLDLDYTFVHPHWDREISLRWVYLHMVTEYARHNGHADLLRERIDGVTGE